MNTATVKVTVSQDHIREFVSQKLGIDQNKIYFAEESVEVDVFIKDYKRGSRTKLREVNNG